MNHTHLWSDDELRARAAELSGAKWYRSGGHLTYLFPSAPPNPLFRLVESPKEITPQHLQYVPKLSLDWVHELEKTIPQDVVCDTPEQAVYMQALESMVGSGSWQLMTATARQRLEAYVIAMEE